MNQSTEEPTPAGSPPKQVLNEDEVGKLVNDNLGWATSIAKSVARAWNMDWQLDGLDGGAYEALLFCARRFDPARGVPFRAYARRRIHESATEEARKSKSWQQGVGANTQAEQDAREISARLFEIFPELREGGMIGGDDGINEDGMRASVRQMLTGASLVAAFKEIGIVGHDTALEYKELVLKLSALEPVHQSILWAIYWQGQSMRSVAESWELDDLSVIREHREILIYLSELIDAGKKSKVKPLKVRRALHPMVLRLKKGKDPGPFSQLLSEHGFVKLDASFLLVAGVVGLLCELLTV
jgi:hypothetical protein